MDGGIELDGTDQRYRLAGWKVLCYSVDEVRGVNADRNEDVQRRDLGDCYRYQAAMRIVYEKIATQRSSCIVVDAARSIRHIAHDQRRCAWTEACQDIRYRGRKQQQAFGKLQSNGSRARGPYTMDTFVDLEAVVWGEEGDGFVDVGIVKDVVGDGIQRAGSTTRLGHYASELALEHTRSLCRASHTLYSTRVLDVGIGIWRFARRIRRFPSHEPSLGLPRHSDRFFRYTVFCRRA